jgi:signal transduction histidine kinase
VSSAHDDVASLVVRHLAEIGAGRCSITDDDLAREPSETLREILVGLVTLHEDLQFERTLCMTMEERRGQLVEELRRAIAARDDFLSVASHELRTPISTLQLQIDSLERGIARNPLGARDDALRPRVEVMKRQVARLGRLVGELLDVSRINAGRLELNRAEVDLRTIVEDVLARYVDDPAARASIGKERLESVVGAWDAFRIDQVVTNLIGNALRYGRGKPIAVRTARVGAEALLVVEDQGIGVPVEQKAHIFEQFARAVSSQHYGGLGLGLWIVQRIVGAHGGSITVDSEPGHGATFAVRLPLEAPAP